MPSSPFNTPYALARACVVSEMIGMSISPRPPLPLQYYLQINAVRLQRHTYRSVLIHAKWEKFESVEAAIIFVSSSLENEWLDISTTGSNHTFGKALGRFWKSDDLGRADKGEVERIKEENDIFAAIVSEYIVVQFPFNLGRLTLAWSRQTPRRQRRYNKSQAPLARFWPLYPRHRFPFRFSVFFKFAQVSSLGSRLFCYENYSLCVLRHSRKILNCYYSTNLCRVTYIIPKEGKLPKVTVISSGEIKSEPPRGCSFDVETFDDLQVSKNDFTPVLSTNCTDWLVTFQWTWESNFKADKLW